MIIRGYSIIWLLVPTLLMVIILMAIGGYSIDGHWWLIIGIILVVIDGY